MDCLERIRDLAATRGWSMYTLAQEAGIPQSTLSNLFIRCNSPSVATLEKLCGAFGITLAEFFAVGPSSPFEDEVELLSIWRRLPKDAKEHFIALMKTAGKQ